MNLQHERAFSNIETLMINNINTICQDTKHKMLADTFLKYQNFRI